MKKDGRGEGRTGKHNKCPQGEMKEEKGWRKVKQSESRKEDKKERWAHETEETMPMDHDGPQWATMKQGPR